MPVYQGFDLIIAGFGVIIIVGLIAALYIAGNIMREK